MFWKSTRVKPESHKFQINFSMLLNKYSEKLYWVPKPFDVKGNIIMDKLAMEIQRESYKTIELEA